MNIPNTITAGTTLEIPITLTAYPAPTWSLTLMMRGASQIDIRATSKDSQHVLHADPATTAAWLPGRYWYVVRVTDGVNIEQIEEGEATIAPDLATVNIEYDGRGHVRKVLDAIEAVIEGRASKDQERYRIKDRELQRTPVGELLNLRNLYRRELVRQKQAARGSELLGRRVLVRF
ncbi:MAG: hypothetical protein PF501_19045 [Salinisphaera sp.]|nr:hypothetical protein [Salinisphaera sp.]